MPEMGAVGAGSEGQPGQDLSPASGSPYSGEPLVSKAPGSASPLGSFAGCDQSDWFGDCAEVRFGGEGDLRAQGNGGGSVNGEKKASVFPLQKTRLGLQLPPAGPWKAGPHGDCASPSSQVNGVTRATSLVSAGPLGPRPAPGLHGACGSSSAARADEMTTQ